MATAPTLSGELPVLIVGSTILSVPISLGLLRWYRRAVIAGMRRGNTPVAEPSPVRGQETVPHGRFTMLDAPEVHSGLARLAIHRLNAFTVVVTLAGLCFAATLSSVYVLAVKPEVFGLRSIAPDTGIFSWPAVLILMIVSPRSKKFRLGVLAL